MLNDNARRAWLIFIALTGFVVGFAFTLRPQLVRETPQKVEGGSLLRDAARAVVIGRAAETAQRAARWSRPVAFRRALEQLRAAGEAETAVRLAGEVAVTPAERAVQQAMLRDQLLAGVGAAPSGDEMSGRTAELYRQALELDPNFDSADPMKLNALGYFLAEHGKSRAEFETAERLTRGALKLWSEVLDQMAPDNPRRLLYEYYRAQLARDSLAWALFKQERYDEAQREQERAVRTAQQVAARSQLRVAADLYYHLGAIYRAQDRFDAARRQFLTALHEDPEHEEARRALEAMGGLPGEEEDAPDGSLPFGHPPLDESPHGGSPFDGSPFEDSPDGGGEFEIPGQSEALPVRWRKRAAPAGTI